MIGPLRISEFFPSNLNVSRDGSRDSWEGLHHREIFVNLVVWFPIVTEMCSIRS